jgi:hypothetical protein
MMDDLVEKSAFGLFNAMATSCASVSNSALITRQPSWKEDGKEGPTPIEHMRQENRHHSCSTGLQKKSLPIRLIIIKI